MSRSPFAEINREILMWARQTSGLEVPDAARKVGTTPENLKEWESGKSYPTVKQLRKLAKAYLRPIGLFFLPELPKDLESIKDFRKIHDVPQEEMSSALRFEIRLAWARRDEAIELARDLGEKIRTIDYRVSLKDNPNQVANKLRGLLAISINEQTKWRTKNEAFSSWRNAIENLGILVFQTGLLRNLIVDTAEARGFSISKQPFPVIVVNGKDHPTARCFTLIHELTHILMHDSGLCDLHNPLSPTSDIDRVEVFCNYVAGAVVVPANTLLGDEIVQKHGADPEWNDEELGSLSKRFWVSSEVILRRLLILKQTTQMNYQRWRNEKKDQYPGPSEKEGEMRIPTATRVTIRNGKLFPKLVLRSLANDLITTYEASDILGAAPDRLVDVQYAIY
ncbi:MAG: XRE family transcriptional regulator [Sedimentisphaerales bacterium]|jgi:Zn-dependent peptidase ImmA (M78 family)